MYLKQKTTMESSPAIHSAITFSQRPMPHMEDVAMDPDGGA